MAVAWHAMTFH